MGGAGNGDDLVRGNGADVSIEMDAYALDAEIAEMEEALRLYSLIKVDFYDNEYEQVQRQKQFYEGGGATGSSDGLVSALFGGTGEEFFSSMWSFSGVVMNPWRWAVERLIGFAAMAGERMVRDSEDTGRDGSGAGEIDGSVGHGRERDMATGGDGGKSSGAIASTFMNSVLQQLVGVLRRTSTPLTTKIRNSKRRDKAVRGVADRLLSAFNREESDAYHKCGQLASTSDGGNDGRVNNATLSDIMSERLRTFHRLKGECGGAASELLMLEGSIRDLERAAEVAQSSSSKYGDARSQWIVGFLHSTGTVLEYSKPMSILNYYFAAVGNETNALVTMGRNFMDGRGMPKAEPTSILYYMPVAKRILDRFKTKTIGTATKKIHVRLEDLDVSGSRIGHLSDANDHAQQQDNDLFQYYLHNADMGDVSAQSAVGHLMNDGGLGWSPERQKALQYLKRAADGGDMQAMASLGHMYANGIGTEANSELAIECFEMAAEKHIPAAFYGLGYMYLSGHGVDRNYDKAYTNFKLAAAGGHLEAHYYLGIMNLIPVGTKRDIGKATTHLKAAAKHGHVVAAYNLASLYIGHRGITDNVAAGRVVQSPPNFNKIVEGASLFERIVRGNYVTNIQSAAYDAFIGGDDEGALLLYLMGAQQGSNRAASNAAWLLQKQRGIDGKVAKRFPGGADYLLISLLNDSAISGHVRSLLQLGDLFYYGRGVERNLKLAFGSYHDAMEQGSAQAMFNLGTMYQFGIGVEQDFHLAKRFYDGALGENSGEAFWPATLALSFLQVHMCVERHARAISLGDGEEYARDILARGVGLASSAEGALALALLALMCLLLVYRGRRRRRRRESEGV